MKCNLSAKARAAKYDASEKALDARRRFGADCNALQATEVSSIRQLIIHGLLKLGVESGVFKESLYTTRTGWCSAGACQPPLRRWFCSMEKVRQ